MPSPKARKRLPLVLTSVCGISFLVMAFLMAKPQRDADRLVQVLERVQVGRTRIEDIAPALRRAGSVEGVKGGECEADLNGPPRTKAPHPTDGNGGSPSPAELQPVCGYALLVENKFLHGLKLAPITNIAVSIEASGGTVDQIILWYATGEFGNIGVVHFIQSVAGKVTTCGRDTCVGRSYGSDGAVVRLNVQASADAPSIERNRLLQLNTRCLSKIGGCKNASELLPISEKGGTRTP
jgi:hypothetical protein